MHGEPVLAGGFHRLSMGQSGRAAGRGLSRGADRHIRQHQPLHRARQSVAGVRTYVFESLMARNRSEPFSLYGLLAETIDVAPDRRRVTFRLRPGARFSDGVPVTAADVRFSLESRCASMGGRTTGLIMTRWRGSPRPIPNGLLLPRRGRPGARAGARADADPAGAFLRRARFRGLDARSADRQRPYRFQEIKPGERVIYRRDPHWWGRGLAVNRGLWNFDEVRFDYSRRLCGARGLQAGTGRHSRRGRSGALGG